jgi:ketosteroid isomerase-like protein
VGSPVRIICLAHIVIGFATASAFAQDATPASTAAADRIAIERLHQLDVEATYSDKADELVKLWDNDAARIQPGRPTEIGKALIYANDKRWESTSNEQTLCYKPEIQNLQIAGNLAFEWGYFSYKSSTDGKLVTGRGKVARVLKRQPDGSWKFVSVMGYPEKLESAAPVSHPCE